MRPIGAQNKSKIAIEDSLSAGERNGIMLPKHGKGLIRLTCYGPVSQNTKPSLISEILRSRSRSKHREHVGDNCTNCPSKAAWGTRYRIWIAGRSS
jgi:hypothetical protein